MNSISEAAERQLYLGLAGGGTGTVAPAALLKLLRRGVVESGELAYGRRYLAGDGALPLNPLQLPLQAAAFTQPEARLRDGGALPLTVRDALPDSWGRRVLEARHGRPLDDVDALLLTNDDRIGALAVSEALPIAVAEPPDLPVDLDAVAEAARQLETGIEPDARARALLQGGASLGGARPKATCIVDGARWLAKFPSRADDADLEVVEAATLSLARVCGIAVPDFHLRPLARGHALLLRRFDRSGPAGPAEGRLHYLSCSALLDVPYASDRGSYADFAQALRRLSAQPAADLRQLFTRLVFNLAVGNSDDHVKNHGAIDTGGGRWRLAPAFDLVPQLAGNAGYQELAILPGRRESHLDLVREAAGHFNLSPAEADAEIGRMLAEVGSGMQASVAAHGGDTALARRVGAFVAQQLRRIRQ